MNVLRDDIARRLYLPVFADGQLKNEIFWKAIPVALNRLIKRLRRHPVYRRQIGIQDHLLPAYGIQFHVSK